MKYLVDPQLVTDMLDGASEQGKRAMALIKAHRADDLILAPTSYFALSPAFMGMSSMQDRFLDNLGIRMAKKAPAKVLDVAYAAWSRYQAEHSNDDGGNSVFDQLYIGAYALVFDGIMTRQGELYRRYFETLNILEP